MKCSQRFLTLRGYSATSVSGSTWYLLIHLTELSYYLRLVSLMSLRWENYSQVSPWKVFEHFSFSSVSQAVSTGVLRQGVFKVSHASRMTFISRFHNLSLCFFYRDNKRLPWCISNSKQTRKHTKNVRYLR